MFCYYSNALFKNKHLTLFYQLSLIYFSSFSPVKGRRSAQKSCVSARSLGRIFKAPNGWVKGCMQFWSLMFLFIELVYVYNFQSQIYKANNRIPVSFVALSQPSLFLTYCPHLQKLLALWLFCPHVSLSSCKPCVRRCFSLRCFRRSLLGFCAGVCVLSSGYSVPHHIQGPSPHTAQPTVLSAYPGQISLSLHVRWADTESLPCLFKSSISWYDQGLTCPSCLHYRHSPTMPGCMGYWRLCWTVFPASPFIFSLFSEVRSFCLRSWFLWSMVFPQISANLYLQLHIGVCDEWGFSAVGPLLGNRTPRAQVSGSQPS